MNTRKPKIGVLLLCPPRFHDLGEGTIHGTYDERKKIVSEDILKHFDYADVVYPGLVYTKEDMEKTILLFKEKEVDMVFAHFLSWSDDFAWVRFLRDCSDVPLVYATIIRDHLGFENSFTEDTFIEFLAAGGIVGSLEGSGDLRRFHREKVLNLVGLASDVFAKTKTFAKACALRGELRHNQIALLPSYNEAMWSTYIHPYDVFMKVGPELRFLTIAELMEVIDTISEEECKKATKEILSKYIIKGTIDEEKMNASVRGSLALEKIARKYNCELLILNDIDKALMRNVGLRPGFTPCPGTDDILVTPEGDIGAGLACYFLKKLTGQHVSFIEPFYVDHDKHTFHAGHAGPNDYTDPEGKTIVATDTRFAKSNFRYAGAPFANHLFAPGEKTMCFVGEKDGKFRIVATIVDVLESEHFLDGYSHGLFKTRIPEEEFFAKLIDIGVTQHYGITKGNHLEELKDLALVLGFDYYEI